MWQVFKMSSSKLASSLQNSSVCSRCYCEKRSHQSIQWKLYLSDIWYLWTVSNITWTYNINVSWDTVSLSKLWIYIRRTLSGDLMFIPFLARRTLDRISELTRRRNRKRNLYVAFPPFRRHHRIEIPESAKEGEIECEIFMSHSLLSNMAII